MGETGTVRHVAPEPTTPLMACGVRRDGEDPPRLVPPAALARRDPEADDGADDSSV